MDLIAAEYVYLVHNCFSFVSRTVICLLWRHQCLSLFKIHLALLLNQFTLLCVQLLASRSIGSPLLQTKLALVQAKEESLLGLVRLLIVILPCLMKE
jgi:hypothetical protein